VAAFEDNPWLDLPSITGPKMNHDSNENLPRVAGAAVPQEIRWVESGARFSNFGHGVQFFHGARRRACVVAFLCGFEWLHRPGSPATVRLLSIRPRSIPANQWAGIIRSVREAVPVFLEAENNLDCSFRYGPIRILING
jgi:hypothetical protein